MYGTALILGHGLKSLNFLVMKSRNKLDKYAKNFWEGAENYMHKQLQIAWFWNFQLI